MSKLCYYKETLKPCALYKRTLELLKKDKRGINTIFLKSGVPPDWLRMFRSGGIPHASVNRVVKLYEFLSGNKVLGYKSKPYTDLSKPCELYAKVLDLLKADPRNVNVIHRDSGIPPDWLRLLRDDKILNPGVNRVVKLYEFLTGKTLDIK